MDEDQSERVRQMLEKITYVEKNKGAVILRCYGSGSHLELPERVAGLPVKELADHCFAEEGSLRYQPFQIRTAVREYTESGICFVSEDESGGQRAASDVAREYSPIKGEMLEDIWLPDGLEGIGDYGFYGCDKLKKLSFPAGLMRLGGGVFVACNHVREIRFRDLTETQTPRCMKDVLAELTYEIEAVLENSRGEERLRLTFPEYYEESKENTPARIIEIIFHGTGYKYRQCFQNRQLDFHQYDAWFPLAAAQEFFPTLIRLVTNRLSTPQGLSEEARARYLEWLRREYRQVGAWILEQDRIDLLKLLGDLGYYTEEILDDFLREATEKKAAEAVSCLMDTRRRLFAPAAGKRRKYEL